MKKNLMFAGLLLSMILVLGIVPFVSALPNIAPGPPAGSKCRIADQEGTSEWSPTAGQWSCKMEMSKQENTARTNIIGSSGTTTGTSSTSSAKSAKKYSGWTPVEAADSNIGICYMKDVSSGRAKATAKIIGLFIKK